MLVRRGQIRAVGGLPMLVVALHAGAAAGKHGHAQPVAGASVGAAKAVAGGERHPAVGPRGRRAVGIGDPRHRPGSILRLAGRGLEAVERRARHRRPYRGPANPRRAAPGSASPAQRSSGRCRAAATASSARVRSVGRSVRVVAAVATRRPTITRSPISRASLRSRSSSAPRRQDRLRLVRSPRTASAESAPASRAAARTASSRSSLSIDQM